MTLGELKSGFFGYKKTSVYQYITSMEEKFSAMLAAKEEEAGKAAERYQQRIDALEAELRQIKEQYEAQRSEQLVIANTLMEAQRYAEKVKRETEQKRQEAQQRLEEAAAEKNRELEGYSKQIQDLRAQFLAALREMDDTAGQLEKRAEQLRESGCGQNLSLFCRRTGTWDQE